MDVAVIESRRWWTLRALGVAVLGSVLADAYHAHLPAGTPQAARDSVAGAVLVVCAAVATAGAVLTAVLLPGQAPPRVAEEESGHELARLT